MLRDCYYPKFQYRKDGPTAGQAWKLFIQDFHFLPDCTSEPARLGKMIQRLLHEQSSLKIRPPDCPRHQIRMVMLGGMGFQFVHPKNKGSIRDVHVTGNGGVLMVAIGICRCPYPGCFFVASPEQNALLCAAEVD